MYEDYFQLRTDPFRLSPDHRFGFAHSSYEKARAYMKYALHRAEGFVMITGTPGSGKTTLVKLLCRLYEPTEGRILLDGLPLNAWDDRALRRRIGVIFQDFVRYQLLVGENIGAGDERAEVGAERQLDVAARTAELVAAGELTRQHREHVGAVVAMLTHDHARVPPCEQRDIQRLDGESDPPLPHM